MIIVGGVAFSDIVVSFASIGIGVGGDIGDVVGGTGDCVVGGCIMSPARRI